MNIDSYKTLISNLPVWQQSFTTRRKTWHKAEKEISWLRVLNDRLFCDHLTLTISRQDIFETVILRETIVKAIYWGYPGGMRGNNFINILKHIDKIENALNELKNTVSPSSDDFTKLTSTFKGVTGLGFSTYSKLLYFLQYKFNDNPCLILDQRLISVFTSRTYSNFYNLDGIRSNNKEAKYLEYIHLTNQISKQLGTKGENIEQFLFLFGNNLKIDTKISNLWNGYCPESLLKGKTARMRLNQHDFYESEETGLQICITGPLAVILNFRGKGKFRTSESYGDEVENGQILSPQNTDMPPFNYPTTSFNESEEIEIYISNIR